MHPGPGPVRPPVLGHQGMLDIGDQRGPLLLRGRQPRRLAQPIARQHLGRGNPQQPALLQRRQLPGVGDGEEALERAACWRAAPHGGWPAAGPIAVRCGAWWAMRFSHGPYSILPKGGLLLSCAMTYHFRRSPGRGADTPAAACCASGSIRTWPSCPLIWPRDPSPAGLQPPHHRRHGRSRRRLQAADRLLQRAAAAEQELVASIPTSASARRTRWSSSMPSATTSATRPRPTPARPSTATAPTPSR